MLFHNKQYIKQYTYNIVSEPSAPYIPLDIIKQHLRITPDDVYEDDYLTLLSNVVYKFAEKYTKRNFLTTQFITYRDTFCTCCFVLRRSPLQSVQSIEYLVNNVWTTLDPATYYNTLENDFSRILRTQNLPWPVWPTNKDPRQQSIRINFTVGFGGNYTSIPPELVIGMLQQIAALYENRGDCAGDCARSLPGAARDTYDIYRIKDMTGAQDCGCVNSGGWWYGQ